MGSSTVQQQRSRRETPTVGIMPGADKKALKGPKKAPGPLIARCPVGIVRADMPSVHATWCRGQVHRQKSSRPAEAPQRTDGCRGSDRADHPSVWSSQIYRSNVFGVNHLSACLYHPWPFNLVEAEAGRPDHGELERRQHIRTCPRQPKGAPRL